MVIPYQERQVIRDRFAADLAGPVKIDYFHQRASAVMVPGREPCRSCETVKTLLGELAALSPKIDLKVWEWHEEQALARRRRVERVPGIVLRGEVNRPLRVFGLPAGHFFAVLLQAILDVARPAPDPPPEVARWLKKLRAPGDLAVFVAAGHMPSAAAARAAFGLALASPRVSAAAYEIDEFAGYAAAGGIQALPTTVVDGRHAVVGLASEGALARYLYELQAHPKTAGLRAPSGEPGSVLPWQPPAPQQGATRDARPAPGPAASERRTPGGLILPR